MPRQDVLNGLCLLGKVLFSVAKEARTGRQVQVNFDGVTHLSQVQPEMEIQDYHGSITCPRDHAMNFVACRSLILADVICFAAAKQNRRI